MDPQVVLFVLGALLTVLNIFGGFVLNHLNGAIKELRHADDRIRERMADFVSKDELRELRTEQRANFDRIFNKLDELKEQVSQKADRHEVR